MPAPASLGLGNSEVVPRPRLAVAAALVALAVGACDKGSRQERFCGKLVKEHEQLAVVPSDPGQLDDYLNRYRQLEKIAPLAIEDDWRTITDLMVAVASEDLSDPAAADRLRDRAVAATKSVDAVRLYALKTCGVDLVIGTVATTSTTTPGRPPTSTAPATLPPTVP
jgi:hypothetical protein